MNNVHLDLKRIDLNLLQLFNALYKHGSVSGAAYELAMSPSAFSHGLTRLRTSLNDVLFVRRGAQMVPTAKSIEIADTISLALKLLSETLQRAGPFDPRVSSRNFIFTATDFTAFAVLPRCIAAIEKVAPQVSTRIRYADHSIPVEELRTGKVDFSIGYTMLTSETPPDIQADDWFTDRYVVITRKGHPACSQGLSLETYLAAKHVVVTPWNHARGEIDQLLEDLNLKRHVAVYLPTVLAAPFIVGSSEMLMTLPRLAATTLAQAAEIQIHEPPFHIPDYCIKLFSHSNYAQSDAHVWMAKTLLGTTFL
ncbi:LysR family transcriptional regulator [Roseateles oligotrophus]|uniref:LysR family transcriptional regulator n=1 Tax=Roseateles oligotrophus TaxID=1769250 RepID=A0ABT2YFV9_9BURK|nr:LysR family transcriptional regulator [Roseateles oligotrophus]MCV2368896.1 LysR family transcriptional regulator [Roseateles oligotrophus]